LARKKYALISPIQAGVFLGDSPGSAKKELLPFPGERLY